MPHFPHFLHFSVYILSPPHLSSKLVSFLFLFSSISLPLPSTSISLPCSCSTLVSPCPFLFCRGSLFLALSVYLFLFHSRFCFLCFSYFFSPLFTYFSSLPACSLSIGLSHYLSTSLSLSRTFFSLSVFLLFLILFFSFFPLTVSMLSPPPSLIPTAFLSPSSSSPLLTSLLLSGYVLTLSSSFIPFPRSSVHDDQTRMCDHFNMKIKT